LLLPVAPAGRHLRSITNACINRTQREKPVVSLNGIDSVDTQGADPQELAKASELGRAFERGLEKLSVTQRAAIELKSLGHTLQDIADTLGLTPTNVGVLIHRARQTLTTELAAYLE
jgi:RNA polymerase sigma-70 factor (ECF subfamily)